MKRILYGILFSFLFVCSSHAACWRDDNVPNSNLICETLNQARAAANITKTDANNLVKIPTRGLYIGDLAACTIAVRMPDSGATVIIFPSVQPGAFLPLAINQLMSTNTTCTAVVALY